MDLPINPQEISIMRQEHGWSVFYRNERYDYLVLYEKCTLEEAAMVSQEFWDTGFVSSKTIPQHYKKGTK